MSAEGQLTANELPLASNSSVVRCPCPVGEAANVLRYQPNEPVLYPTLRPFAPVPKALAGSKADGGLQSAPVAMATPPFALAPVSHSPPGPCTTHGSLPFGTVFTGEPAGPPGEVTRTATTFSPARKGP